jgi:3-phosphoglycerate kinase
MSYKLISSIPGNISGKTILLRVDYNVPMDPMGNILSSGKISATLPTVQFLIEKKAIVIILSHLGRPKAKEENLSLRPTAEKLSELLLQRVEFIDDCIGAVVQGKISKLGPGQVALLENLRCTKPIMM